MITDNPNVLPCDRNNCRCGDNNNCMYYNSPNNGFYNYNAVQGSGDKMSPYYSCPSVAYDVFNQEDIYADGGLGGTNGEPQLGAYNDMREYGGINGPRDTYGSAPISYPDKPTCSNHPNKAMMTPEAENRDADYDKWDRYHRYHQMQLMDNTAQHPHSDSMFPRVMSGKVNLTPWILLLAIGLTIYYLHKTGKMSTQVAGIAAVVAVV